MKKYVIALLLLISLHFLFTLRTNNFFSTDDFFVLSYLKSHTIFETAKNFLIQGDLFGFRKLTGYILFGIIYKIFGANHLAFDIALFVLQAANLALLFFVVLKVTNDNFKSFFVSLIFNKYYFSYYSNIHEVLVTFFSFLTLFLIFYIPKKPYFYFITFVFALFSRETAVTLPLVVWILKDYTKLPKKNIYFMFLISIIFSIYVLYFFINGNISQINSSYIISLNIKTIINGLLFFVNIKVILLSLLLPFAFRKQKLIFLFFVVMLTLIPASLLVNRKEIYYIYLPFGYLMIYLSLFLPNINFRNVILYLILFLLFGGRSILPQIAWHEFPNWQKESINSVLDRIVSGRNDFSDLLLERDAKLMIESGTTDSFLKERHKYD